RRFCGARRGSASRAPEAIATAGRSAIGQRDVELQDVAVAFSVELHLDCVAVDVDVFLDHREQLVLQLGEPVAPVACGALVRDQDLQTLFRDASGALPALSTEIAEQTHHPQLPKRRPKKPFFSGSRKRCGRLSPSRRATASRYA